MSERWSGPFISPNNAGLAMALGVVGAVVVLAILRGRGSWWWGLRGAVGATLPFLAWWLAASGSRAAWLGLAVALGWLMRVGLVPWRWVAGLGLVLVLLITVLPGGRERFSGDILAHPSISHRLALIQGHLAMAWDHPWGVPLADAMPLCEAWYLPAAVHGFYGGSLNDTLVLWGGHGLGAVALVILVAVTVLRWAARPAWRHHPIVAGCVALALLVLVAGQCQAHGHVRAWPQWTGWGIAATLVLALAWVGGATARGGLPWPVQWPAVSPSLGSLCRPWSAVPGPPPGIRRNARCGPPPVGVSSRVQVRPGA